MNERSRRTWGSGGPTLTPTELVGAEIREAFAPVEEWRNAAPAERSLALQALVMDTLTSLAWWGWAIDITRGRDQWTVTAARSIGCRRVRAKVVGEDYFDAIWKLGRKLGAAWAIEEAQRNSNQEIAA